MLAQFRLSFGGVHEIILQHVDFDPTRFSFVTRDGSIPQTHHTNSINGDLMAEHQVPNDRISHLAGRRVRSQTMAGRETVDFHDVIVLVLQWTSHLIKSILSTLT
jgi:hypothetical protein